MSSVLTASLEFEFESDRVSPKERAARRLVWIFFFWTLLAVGACVYVTERLGLAPAQSGCFAVRRPETIGSRCASRGI